MILKPPAGQSGQDDACSDHGPTCTCAKGRDRLPVRALPRLAVAALLLVGASSQGRADPATTIWGAQPAPAPATKSSTSAQAQAQPAAKPAPAPVAKSEKAPAPASPSPAAPALPGKTAAAPAPLETGALPKPSVQPVADWLLICQPPADSKTSCALTQTVRDQKQRRIIELLALKRSGTAFLQLIVPIGISIPYGVTLNLDDTQKLPTQLVDCTPDGCRAVMPLDDKLVQRIKSAKSLAVTFQDSKSGKILTVSGSPKGFADGVDRVLASG